MTKNLFQDQTKKLWHLWDCRPCNKNQDGHLIETREKILIAAFEEIYEHGYQAASLSNILKNTGATKGALYHHFKNKKELGYAVLDEVVCESYRDSWITPLEDVDDPITVIKELLVQHEKMMTQEDIRRGCPLHNLAQEMSPIDDDFRERISKAYVDWQAAIENAFERGIKAGNVTPSIDSKSLSLLFVATLEGCMGMAKTTQNLSTLSCCGEALIERIETLHPKSKISSET
jgi:AcrR family transcriptional regulator